MIGDFLRSYSNAVLGPKATSAQQIADEFARLNQTTDAMVNPTNIAPISAPGVPSNAGQAEAASPEEQLKRKIELMATSDVPEFRKMGLTAFNTMLENELTPSQPKEVTLSNAAKMARDSGLTPGSPEYNKFITDYAFKANTSINMGGEDRVTVSEATNLVMDDGSDVRPGTPWSEIQGRVKTKQSTEQSVSGMTADNLYQGFDTLYDSLDKGADDAGMLTLIRNIPGMTGELANSVMNELGIDQTKAEVDFVNSNRRVSGSIVRLMSGASATNEERTFWAQIQPRETDSPYIKRYKYNEMIKFGRTIAERAKKAGVKDVPDFNRAKLFDLEDEESGEQPIPAPVQSQPATNPVPPMLQRRDIPVTTQGGDPVLPEGFTWDD